MHSSILGYEQIMLFSTMTQQLSGCISFLFTIHSSLILVGAETNTNWPFFNYGRCWNSVFDSISKSVFPCFLYKFVHTLYNSLEYLMACHLFVWLFIALPSAERSWGKNPTDVYWLSGLCATGVLRLARNWEQPGIVIAALPIRNPLYRCRLCMW